MTIMKKSYFLPAILGIALSSCNNPTSTPEKSTSEESIKVEDYNAEEAPEKEDYPETYERDGLKIYPLMGSPEYEDAQLTLNTPENSGNKESGSVAFDFSVENYVLGAQTADAADKGLANSGKGQHIHLIIDNGPYSAHYEPTFKKEIADGHHLGLAFLSRSYHESVKNGSAEIFQFHIGEVHTDAMTIDLSQPLLFYSRPKGEYKGDGAKTILLDFYVANTELSAGGNSARVTINGDKVFDFDTWQPYLIEGLPMGENTVAIELIDEEGNAINPDLNSTVRKFILSE